jgi:hypothetical protein
MHETGQTSTQLAFFSPIFATCRGVAQKLAWDRLWNQRAPAASAGLGMVRGCLSADLCSAIHNRARCWIMSAWPGRVFIQQRHPGDEKTLAVDAAVPKRSGISTGGMRDIDVAANRCGDPSRSRAQRNVPLRATATRGCPRPSGRQPVRLCRTSQRQSEVPRQGVLSNVKTG